MPTYSAPVDVATLQPSALAAELRRAVEEGLVGPLAAYDDTTASIPAAEGAWSAKQVVGHLIDSATNNLQRAVRLSIDTSLDMPGYKQEEWVTVQNYQQRHWADLVILWSALNLHFAHVIAQTSADHYTRLWHHQGEDLPLGFILHDYIGHMRHHLSRLPKV